MPSCWCSFFTEGSFPTWEITLDASGLNRMNTVSYWSRVFQELAKETPKV